MLAVTDCVRFAVPGGRSFPTAHKLAPGNDRIRRDPADNQNTDTMAGGNA